MIKSSFLGIYIISSLFILLFLKPEINTIGWIDCPLAFQVYDGRIQNAGVAVLFPYGNSKDQSHFLQYENETGILASLVHRLLVGEIPFKCL
jgi:hypothetical protein